MAKKINASDVRLRTLHEDITFGSGLGIKPAPYLKVLEYDKQQNLSIVMKAGTLVTLDNRGFLIPADGGDGSQTITYDSLDDGEVWDLDDFNGSETNDPATILSNLGTPPHEATTQTLPSNPPVGMLLEDVYAYRYFADNSYKFQESVSMLKKGMVMLALDEDHEGLYGGDSWQSYIGLSLKPGTDGYPNPLQSSDYEPAGTTTTEIATVLEKVHKQSIGKLELVADINNNLGRDWTGGMEHVVPIQSLNLPGNETSGANNGIDPDSGKGLIIDVDIR